MKLKKKKSDHLTESWTFTMLNYKGKERKDRVNQMHLLLRLKIHLCES